MLAKYVFVGALAMTLSGCVFSMDPMTKTYDEDTGTPITDSLAFHQGTKSKLETLDKEGYHLKLVRVEDKRMPLAFVKDPEDNIIYEYHADKLLRGTLPYMEALLTRHLPFNAQGEQQYLAEVDLKDIHTAIHTGDLWAGSFGNYVIEIEGDVVIRDQTSKVVVNEAVRIAYKERRMPYKGRNPDAAQDKKRLLEAMDGAAQKFSVEMGWAVRRELHNKKP